MDFTCSIPHLYILDKRMPDFDGLDICRHIRETTSGKGIPIIMISASPKFGPHALKARAKDFLEKPFSFNKLLRWLRSI